MEHTLAGVLANSDDIDEMRHNKIDYQSKDNTILLFFFEIINCDPTVYRTNYLDELCSCMEIPIGLKRVQII